MLPLVIDWGILSITILYYPILYPCGRILYPCECLNTCTIAGHGNTCTVAHVGLRILLQKWEYIYYYRLDTIVWCILVLIWLTQWKYAGVPAGNTGTMWCVLVYYGYYADKIGMTYMSRHNADTGGYNDDTILTYSRAWYDREKERGIVAHIHLEKRGWIQTRTLRSNMILYRRDFYDTAILH